MIAQQNPGLDGIRASLKFPNLLRIRRCLAVQIVLAVLQKRVEKRPMDVEEVAAAAEAKVRQPSAAKVWNLLLFFFPLSQYVKNR